MPRNKINQIIWPIFKRSPAYLKLAWLLAKEPSIPQRYKIALYGLIVYQISPLHLAVAAVPVVGQIDSLSILLFALKQMITHCPMFALKRCLLKANISHEQFLDDLNVVAKLGGDAIASKSKNVVREVNLVGRVLGKVGMRSLARMVVALEKK